MLRIVDKIAPTHMAGTCVRRCIVKDMLGDLDVELTGKDSTILLNAEPVAGTINQWNSPESQVKHSPAESHPQ